MSISQPNDTTVHITAGMAGPFQKLSLTGKLLYGQIDTAKALLLEQIIPAPGYIFDTRGMEAIDSTGFGLFITIAKQIQKTPNSVVIIVEDNSLREYFTIAKFDLIFPLVDNEAKAIEVLANKATTMLSLEEY
ncbi:STAS domain-containing protein [Aneurinibacillus sp. BA2021]|nr:STAS domain-containing protein [Aneurinibacillus sp. BA2021]